MRDESGNSSLGRRYAFKLSTNLVGLFVNLITQAIIPRGLGPRAYGDFNFITNFFNQIIGFIDMGTSTAFYTKLSQRPREYGLVVFYLYFSILASIMTLLFVLIVHQTGQINSIWPGQTIFYIYLGAGWGIFTWFSQTLNKITDAYGLTVPSEIARIIQKILGLAMIVVLYLCHKLDLANFFYYNFIIIGFLGLAFAAVIKNSDFALKGQYTITREHAKKYIHEFYEYSAPLLLYALAGVVIGILDRWFLQQFAGSEQQGFYSLSYQIGAVCFLFTSAMTPLLMREFSIAYDNKDISQMAYYFRRYIPMLYSVAAYFSCFIAVQSANVVYLFGGGQYKEAVLAVMIMAFYPIHQTYGQLSGSVFFANGQTKLFRNIGIYFMTIGIPITYFLIAPADRFGLDTGAVGLAVKMVGLQFFWVNAQLYYNSKFLGLNYWRYLGHQIISVGCILTIAWITTALVNQMNWMNDFVIANFLLTGFLYTLIIILVAYKFPRIFGIKHEDIAVIKHSINNRRRVK
ncbi:MAG: oligosaccharide flippase family protein [Syntrophomonadaceae bacterium]|nr:oligosaccharide flippase family protein [Syntrophomonadaceae bacterium]